MGYEPCRRLPSSRCKELFCRSLGSYDNHAYKIETSHVLKFIQLAHMPYSSFSLPLFPFVPVKSLFISRVFIGQPTRDRSVLTLALTVLSYWPHIWGWHFRKFWSLFNSIL